MLHGPYGEDGTVQGLLELANVPYVGAGVLASAVGMDKAVMKLVFAAQGPADLRLRSRAEARLAARRARASLQHGRRPARLSGVRQAGESRIERRHLEGEARRRSCATAIELAAEFDRKIVVEAAVPQAREIECAVLGNDEPEASVPGEIIPSREFYDYEAKYLDDDSRTVIPARARPTAQAAEVRRLAIAAFKAIDGAGMARVDFLLAGDSRRALPQRAEHAFPASPRSACTRRCGRRAASPIRSCSIA